MLLLLSAASNLPTHAQSNTELSGAIRSVFTHVETRNRDGSYNTVNALNARLHLRLDHTLRTDLTFSARLAGRYATNQDAFSFPLRGYTGGSGSYDAGETTLDMFQLQWQASPALRITAGRFQGRFPLAGFIPKGMDRYYAANLSISHTDGIWARWNASPTWRIDAIFHHNHEDGSSHAARNPMRFTEPASRIGGYLNLAHRNTSGLWVQREIGVSIYPQSFQRDGNWQTLTVLTGRAMMRLPFEASTGEYWAGGELGFIPEAPTPASAGVPVSSPFSETASMAWQVSAYANNLYDRHTIGILYGQTEPNWVISSSFRPNNTMSEVRYRFTFSSNLNFEMRYRLRTDLYRRSNAPLTQRDTDFYARFTYRF